MNATRRTSPHFSPWRGYLAWLSGVALLLYGLFCWKLASIQPGGADSSGYFNLARCIANGTVHVPARPLPGFALDEAPPYAYAPLGFRPSGDSRTLTPTYPPGLPLLFAAAAPLLGWKIGPHLVMVLHAIAGVWLVFALVRQAGLSFWSGAIGAAMLAISPLYLMFSLQAMSDVPALVWSALALWLAGRRKSGAAVLAGLATGMAVLIRPSNLLLGLPLLVALRLDWRRWVALVVGGAPTAIALLIYNRAAYGSAVATGYGDVGTLFSSVWVGMTLKHYAQWLPMILSPLILAAVALPVRARNHTQSALVHGSWVLAVFAFYAGYFHTHETWWYLRFILPAVPSLILAALLVLEPLVQRFNRAAARLAIVATAVVAMMANAWYWNRRFAIHEVGRNERIYIEAIELTRQLIPANAVIIAMQTSGALFYGVNNPIVRWDTLDGNWPRILSSAQKAGFPIYGVLFDFEPTEAFQEKVPGDWVKLVERRNLSLWQLHMPTQGK